MLHFLHWCYTWTALLLANQTRVIFLCVLLSGLSSNFPWSDQRVLILVRVVEWCRVAGVLQLFRFLSILADIRKRFRRVVKGGYRSRFTENKAALSQFTKNTTLAFHASRKIKEIVLGNHGSRRLWKSRFTRKKMAISHFTGNKKGRLRVTKIPFTTLF